MNDELKYLLLFESITFLIIFFFTIYKTAQYIEKKKKKYCADYFVHFIFIIFITFSVWLSCVLIGDIAVFMLKYYGNKNLNYPKIEKIISQFYSNFNLILYGFKILILPSLLDYVENQSFSIFKSCCVNCKKFFWIIIMLLSVIAIGALIYYVLFKYFQIDLYEIYDNNYSYILNNILNFYGLVEIYSYLSVYIVDMPFHMKGRKICKCSIYESFCFCCCCGATTKSLDEYSVDYVSWGLGKIEAYKNKVDKDAETAKNHLKYAYNQYKKNNNTEEAQIIKIELEKIDVNDIEDYESDDKKYIKYFKRNGQDFDEIVDHELRKINLQELNKDKYTYLKEKYLKYSKGPKSICCGCLPCYICCRKNYKAIGHYFCWMFILLLEVFNLYIMLSQKTQDNSVFNTEEEKNKMTKDAVNNEIYIYCGLLFVTTGVYLVGIFYGMFKKKKFSLYMFMVKNKTNSISLINFLRAYISMIFPLYYISTAFFNRKLNEDYNIQFVKVFHWSYSKNGVFSKIFIFVIRDAILLVFIFFSWKCQKINCKCIDLVFNENSEFYRSESDKSRKKHIELGKSIYQNEEEKKSLTDKNLLKEEDQIEDVPEDGGKEEKNDDNSGKENKEEKDVNSANKNNSKDEIIDVNEENNSKKENKDSP